MNIPSKESLPINEQEMLRNIVISTVQGEMAQVQDLYLNCSSPFQFAKTYSVYIKDWGETRSQIESGKVFAETSSDFRIVLLHELDGVMEAKLEALRIAFQEKFNEPIYNYLGKDGKTKGLFG